MRRPTGEGFSEDEVRTRTFELGCLFIFNSS